MSKLVDTVDGIPIEPGVNDGTGFVVISTALATGREISTRVVELRVGNGTADEVRYLALDRQGVLKLIGILCHALYVNEVDIERFGR